MHELFNLKGAVEVMESLTGDDYDRVASEVVKAYEAVPDVVKEERQGRGRFVACLIRTAGHDFNQNMKIRQNQLPKYDLRLSISKRIHEEMDGTVFMQQNEGAAQFELNFKALTRPAFFEDH